MTQKVLLTGITGFVGQHCAVELLQKGYAVRGSLRSLSRKDEVINGIKKVIDPTGKLEFCELDLSKDDGWDEAMQGCDYVLHVASPFVTASPKDENEIIRPAVDGTVRALNAAKKAGVKRMVITSSVVAMLGDGKGSMNINHESWSDENSKALSAYMKSKTIAEKTAWKFFNEQEGDHKLEVAVVNPGPIYGPTLTNNLSGESMKFFSQMISGKMPMLPKAIINMSDVRDVAKVHVLAMENPEANGKRFIATTEDVYPFSHLAEILKSNGFDKVSSKEAPNFLLKIMSLFNAEIKAMLPFIGNTIRADISQTKNILGFEPTSVEKMALDTANSVKAAMEIQG